MKKLFAIALMVGTITVLSIALFNSKTRSPASADQVAPPDLGFENDIIYYIMVDRFYDANQQNNVPNWAYPLNFKSNSIDPESAVENNDNRFWLKQMMDWTKFRKFQHYWGGDLQGVIHRLPYLKELGITSILISPINDNVNGMFYNNGNSAYHGYWIKDWFRIDEHFANAPSGHIDLDDALRGKELVEQLTKTAHEMGMKVLLDLSLNQSSPIQSQHNPFYFLEHGPIYKDGEKLLQYCYPNPGDPKNKDICEERDDHYLCGKIHKTRISKEQNVTCRRNGLHYLCGNVSKVKVTGPCEEFDDHYICKDEVDKWVHKELGPCRKVGNRYACGEGHLVHFSGPCEILEDDHYNCKNKVTKRIAKENISCLDSLDTSGWYNQFEPAYNWDDEKHVERALIESMADLNQRNPQMKEYLIESTKRWIDLGFDGFRIDGVKHIYKDFLKDFEETLVNYKNDIMLIGEYFDGGHYDKKSMKWLNESSRFTMFDFFFSKNMHNYFRGKVDYEDHGSLAAFDIMLTNDPEEGYDRRNDLHERSNELITFLNNHDIPRMLSEEGNTIDHYKAALKLLMTARGIPALLYGDEIGLAVPNEKHYDTMILGIGADPWNRQMMRWDHISEHLILKEEEKKEEEEEAVYDAEWYQEFVKNGYRFPNDEVVLTPQEQKRAQERQIEIVREKEIFNLTKKLIALRKSTNLFRHGYTRMLRPEKNLFEIFIIDPTPYNFLAMERSILGGVSKDDDQLFYYFWSDKKQTLRFRVELSDGVYRDAIEENNHLYYVSDGIIELEMEPQQVIMIAKGLPSLHKQEREETFEVTINLTVDRLNSGQQIYIVGQDPAFGKWEGHLAIGPLKRKGYNKYQLKLDLPVKTHSAYKFIKMDKYGRQEWESIPNRLIYIHTDKQVVNAHWDSLN